MNILSNRMNGIQIEMLTCKDCGEVIGNVPKSNKVTVCIKCIVRHRAKKREADKHKYSVWGRSFRYTNGDPYEELLDFADSKTTAESKIAELRRIKYFGDWKLWYELSV